MKMGQVKKTTRTIESNIGWRAKQELIRSIQEKGGQIPCFQTGKKSCDRLDCRWRNDCLPT